MSSNSTGRWLFRIAQMAVTGGAFYWLSTKVSMGTLATAATTLEPRTAGLGVLSWLAAFLLGAVRWRWVMHGYGAQAVPPLSWATRWYLIGLFYNNYVPGGVGGDLVRGVAARDAFGGGRTAATQAVAVTIVERVLGLSGLMLFVSFCMTLWPVADAATLRPWTLLGLCVGLGLVAGLSAVRRLAAYLPDGVRRSLEQIPRLERPLFLALALAASVGTHVLTAIAGYFILISAGAVVSIVSAFVFVPLSMATTYLPVSIGGAGLREAAFVTLFGTVGVSADDALVASLSMFAIQLVFAAVGGVAQWLGPSADEAPTEG